MIVSSELCKKTSIKNNEGMNGMHIYFVRHGKTKGNEEGRYIGTTDEKLSEKGKQQLKEKLQESIYPKAAYIYVSPMKRCMETAELLYPGQEKIVCKDFRETDFGAFEGKNYEELKENPQYQAWIDSNGILPFPGGESREEFTKRCIRQFEAIIHAHIRQGRQGDIAFVVHGGTIMAIMEHFAIPKKSYYDWQMKNGEMLVTELVVGEKREMPEGGDNRIFSLRVQMPKENNIPYFPLFVQLAGKKIVVAGAGTIATRRIKSLLGFGADIHIIAPVISEEIKTLSEDAGNNIFLSERNYETGDCTNVFWVIAATNNRKVNRQIGIEAKQNGAFATISDAKEESTVYFPGIAREGNVVAGITAGGKDHALAKKITGKCREYLRKWITG